MPTLKETLFGLAQCPTIFGAGLMTPTRIWMCCPHWRVHSNSHCNLSFPHVRLPGQEMLPDLPQESPPSKKPAPSPTGVAASQEAWGRPGACSWHLPTRSPRRTLLPHSIGPFRWPLGYRETGLTVPRSQRKPQAGIPTTSFSTVTCSEILYPEKIYQRSTRYFFQAGSNT